MLNMLFNEKRFSVLLGASLLSKIGDGLHEFILILTVLKITNNGIMDAGVIYFFRFIPYLLLGPIGGALSDRLSRKMLMLAADLGRMLVTGVFCLLLMADAVTALWLAVIGMTMTAFRTLFQPAFQATIPSIVNESNLPQANGAIQIAGEIGGMVGPAVGGAALAWISNPGQVLLLDAATYLVSALCVLLVRIPAEHIDDKDGAKLTLSGLFGDFGDNLKSVLSNAQLLITIIYSSACILLVGAALRILIPALMKNAGFTDSLVGYALGLIAFGTIIGALVCSKITRDFSTRSLMIYWALYGLVLAALPLGIIHAVSMLASCFFLGVIGAFVDIVLPTNIQQLSTNQNIGKNFSLFSTLANTGEALSGGLAGVFVFFSSVSVGITVIGLLIASVAYVGKMKLVSKHE
jgi:MFS family permease